MIDLSKETLLFDAAIQPDGTYILSYVDATVEGNDIPSLAIRLTHDQVRLMVHAILSPSMDIEL